MLNNTLVQILALALLTAGCSAEQDHNRRSTLFTGDRGDGVPQQSHSADAHGTSDIMYDDDDQYENPGPADDPVLPSPPRPANPDQTPLNIQPSDPRVELPRTFMQTHLTQVPPATHTVNQGDDLQAVLDAANPGDVIELQAGATFNGSFRVRKRAGSGWLTIRTSAYDRLPPQGQRVSPTDAATMATLNSTDSKPSLWIDDGAKNVRIIGIEFTNDNDRTDYRVTNIVRISYDSTCNALADPSENIVFDRVYIHGQPSGHSRNGILSCGRKIAVINSYISEIHGVGDETHGLHFLKGSGPIKIVNNYIAASGINVFFGGNVPYVTEEIPSDIEIRHNHLHKDLSWNPNHPSYGGTHWLAKNLLEFKTGLRALVEGNVLENSWHDSQRGYAFLVKSPSGAIDDITIRSNYVRNVNWGVALCGQNEAYGSTIVDNNVFAEVGDKIFSACNQGNKIQLAIFKNNTALAAGTFLLHLYSDPQSIARLEFQDNVVNVGSGIKADGTAPGTDTLTQWVDSYSVTGNTLIGGQPSTYAGSSIPSSNVFAASLGDVAFTDVTSPTPAGLALQDGSGQGHDLTTFQMAQPVSQ